MSAQESQAFTQLKQQLRDMFQLDRGDLDFGLYRIMNQKREDVTKFLEEKLLPQVREELDKYRPAELDAKVKELKEAEANPGKFAPDYIEGLRKEINSKVDIDKLEKEIYSDLYNFFKRYYSDGDFMSMRRYKEGVYALPYEGEEVKLHWANHDQYYIKTSEDLKNYTFKTKDGKRVRFEVVAGGTETNNNKAAEGKERRFVLHEAEPVKAEGKELFIRFEYVPDESKRKQDAINKDILEQLFNLAEVEAFSLKEKAPTEKDKDRTLLEKHLTEYTAKHQFDYFIHKDLGKFLRQELDFYIKNEIMHLDDIEDEDAPKVESYLGKVKAMRKVAGKIIRFLAQLEDFQKRLWLKKKFVLETHYCVTLDKIIASDLADNLLPQIVANNDQREEWASLFAIDDLDGYSEPLSVEFLKANDKLMVDTKFFDADFKYKLLSIFNDIDEEIDGLLINSDNFQALNLLHDRYKEKIKYVYIDPPYNSPSSEIIYKNTFKHSAWLTLMDNRVKCSKNLLQEDFIYTIAIDENEQERLGSLLDDNFRYDQKTCVTVIHNPGGIQGSNFSYCNDFAYFIYPSKGEHIGKKKRKEGNITPLRDWGGEESKRETARNCFYPILVKEGEIVDFGDVSDPQFHPGSSNIEKKGGVIEVYPVDGNGIERKWRFARNTVNKIQDELFTDYQNGEWVIKRNKSIYRFKTVWDDKEYNSNVYGSKLLGNMLGSKEFDFPKSVYTVKDSILAATQKSKDALVLDYFAGSGTTGHATLLQNAEDGGKRKYILIEMGEYFKIVTKPRVLKASYDFEWREGKPVSREGISQFVKYLSLEQYEDSLDNLGLTKDQTQAALLDSNANLKEQYMLGYMLDVESKGSQSLLNIDAFDDPFSYNLRITRDDDTQIVKVDLIETFNYLLGLHIKTIDRDKNGIVTVTGKNSLGEKCLIIWRNVKEVDNDKLDEWFGKRYSSKDFEFDAIYINGDNNIENMKFEEQTWKVRLIEKEFKHLMFDVQDV